MLTFQKLTTRRRVAMRAAVVMIAIGGLAPWTLTHRHARAQSDSAVTRPSTIDAVETALQFVQKRGGTYYRDQSRPDKPVISVSFSGNSQAADADLKCLKELPNLVELNLYFPTLSDAGLEQLQNLTSLKALSIDSPKVTNAGVTHLAALTGLEILELENVRIDDDGLVPLKGLEPRATGTPGLQPAEARAKPDTYQGIIAARPAPELSTLVARSSLENRDPDATESFWDLLKLRETADPKSVLVLEEILVENLPTTRIHGFAAAQALFAIGTPEAHQILARNQLANGRTRLAIDYTSHWEMREPIRSRYIDRYLLQNFSKSLVVEVEHVAPTKGQSALVVILRNASDQAFHILDDQSGDFLNVRDARGQYIPDGAGRRHGLKPKTAFVELKPGQDHRIPLTLDVMDAARSKSPLRDPSARLIAEVVQSGQRFELPSPGRVEFIALIEAQPLSPEQRTHLKVDDMWHWWSGRAVSKPLTVDLAPP